MYMLSKEIRDAIRTTEGNSQRTKEVNKILQKYDYNDDSIYKDLILEMKNAGFILENGNFVIKTKENNPISKYFEDAIDFIDCYFKGSRNIEKYNIEVINSFSSIEEYITIIIVSYVTKSFQLRTRVFKEHDRVITW